MKKFVAICFALLFAMTAASVYTAIDTEQRAYRWDQYTAGAQYTWEVVTEIRNAQDYNRECLSAVKSLAVENGLLSEREAKMVEVVNVYEEQNTLLKKSLQEAVSKLKEQQDELNKLYDEIGRLQYKIEVLERALDLVPTPADPDESTETDPN